MPIRSATVQAPAAAAATEIVVRGHEITKRFGEGAAAVDALRGVSVEFARGSFTAIMGPSGSGKSTLMHILAGLDVPTSGWVEIDGTRLDGLDDRRLTLHRRREIGFIFQSSNLLPVLNAEQNILLPVRRRTWRSTPSRTPLSPSRSRVSSRAPNTPKPRRRCSISSYICSTPCSA